MLRAAPGASKEPRREVTPTTRQMELRLGEKVTPTPLAVPENQSKRPQPRRTSHIPSKTKTTKKNPSRLKHTQADTRAQSHTSWHDHKECERSERQTPTDIPQHLSSRDKRHLWTFLTHHACQELKEDGSQTPPIA